LTRGLALRDRLAVSFAVALVLAYLLISVCAVVIVNQALRGAVDGRLSTIAQALVAVAGDSRDEIDRKDREQFATISADASGALVLGSDDALVLSTTGEIPAWVPGAVRTAHIGRTFNVRYAGRDLRAVVERRRKHDVDNLIVVWQAMQLINDVESAVVAVLGGSGLVVAIGGYALGAQIARRGLLPLTRITAVVGEIAANDLAARVGPQPHADELGRLAATFDRMLDRLQAAFERQRRFTADASHDLRAPLATLRSEVDLALRRERTAPEYRAALEAIAGDADQLDLLIDALLAAARSDAGDLELRALDLGSVARGSVDGIAPFASAKGVRIETDLPDGCEIKGDIDLLERAVLATLHNAVKYTPAAGAIHVVVAAHADRIELRVRDEGPGFSPAALVHALDRFWRDDAARGRSGGSGLGLAIASEIVRRCDGVLAIDNSDSGGAEVIMRFPASLKQPSSARKATADSFGFTT
jgi:signal transduction histidine kinase